MKAMDKLICALLSIVLLSATLLGNGVAYGESESLDDKQENAIEMLNHITVLSQEVIDSKNSRVCMENAYSSLINNTYPNAVDETTQDELDSLLETMEDFRMLDVKRERLEYVYEQSQAKAIRAAIPNPVGLLSAAESLSPEKLIASVVYMAVDSYTSYNAYKAEAEEEYLNAGWDLDDEEAEELDDLRRSSFNYMLDIVNQYKLPGDYALTEDHVKEFVEYENKSNVAQRIRFLESNKDTYQAYGRYWLVLANAYYKNKKYDKCLNAIEEYEKGNVRLFRCDYDYAKALPLAIDAADHKYGESDKTRYEKLASTWAQAIVKNAGHKDWALRYFATETLADLYARTKNKSYLRQCFEVAYDSVNYLLSEQSDQNTEYLKKVKEEKVPKGSSEEEKKEIETYNNMLKETRKTELPPVYEPLRVNLDLMLAAADELSISKTEREEIDDLIHPDGDALFLTESIDDQYWFASDRSSDAKGPEVDYAGAALMIPASAVTSDSTISVSVVGPNGGKAKTIDDWRVEEVKRGSDKKVSTHKVVYTSDDARKLSWKPGSEVKVTVTPTEGMDGSFTCEFECQNASKEWYDHIKFWEGYKNSLIDYLKVWEDGVVFERVS